MPYEAEESPLSILQPTTRQQQSPAVTGRFIAAGIALGLTWGVSLRAWMTLLAISEREAPQYSWAGTFGSVILPAGIIGGVLGWAEYARRTGGRRHWRYTALAPLLFIVLVVLYQPDFFQVLFSSGLGGGAIGVVVVGLAGGYAFSRRGPLWARASAGVPTVGIVGAFAVGAAIGEAVPGREALPAFIGLTFALLMGLWIGACSIPHRAVLHGDIE